MRQPHYRTRRQTPVCNMAFFHLLNCLTFSVVLVANSEGENAAMSSHHNSFPDLEYVEIDGAKLYLDLFVPEKVKQPPLTVYIHGGGWRSGDRKGTLEKNEFLEPLLGAGYAVASIDYRLSSTAVFPAQIHDCKAAVRWLRAYADEYGFDASRVAAMGTSAGGHLAVLMGVTADVEELEGHLGKNVTESSAVQAIVDFFGPADFLLRSRTQAGKCNQPEGPVYQLLGGSVRKNTDLAKLASPVRHVDAGDPPLFIVHGLMDGKVNPGQSIELYQAYRKHNLPVEITLLPDGGHGGPEFKKLEITAKVIRFLNKHLKNSSGTP